MSENTQDTEKPNPGSDAAIELGCTCPVLDNAHGRGAWGTEGDDALFWQDATCPFHRTPVRDTEHTPETVLPECDA